jgi:geranylgeranyl diphosphate synthase type II
MDTRAYLLERLPLVNAALDAWLPAADAAPAALHAAMRHILFPGGKRLRPGLAFAAAEAVGAAPECALPAAAAVELLHTYSLVHDDLPCMDDDDERRGRPSVHKAYGEATAVLAGDALLTAAFECLCRENGGSEAAARLAASRDLAVASGSLGLVGGQEDDLRFDPAEVDGQRIESVHRRKSAALIAASITCGARLAGASEAIVERLQRCGLAVGVAFQIADDVLDAGEDDPCSLVRAIGVDASRARAEALLEEAQAEIADLGDRAEPLRGLVRYAVRRSE